MIQATAKAPATPAPAAARQAQAPATAGVAAPTASPPPQTVQDIMALRVRRDELSSQLTSVVNRRSGVSRQLQQALTGPDRVGLENRLTVMDKRIAQLEADIAETGRQLTTAPSQLLSSAGNGDRRDGPSPSQQTAMGIVGTVFVAGPLAIALAIRLLRRPFRPAPVALSPDLTGRLDRMEQGIEVIALEVERISEGQRFVTRLMGESADRAETEPARLAAEAQRPR